MDIAKTLEYLGQSVSRERKPFEYEGDPTANNQAAYNSLLWKDGRPKPAYDQLVEAWPYASKWHARRSFFASSDI